MLHNVTKTINSLIYLIVNIQMAAKNQGFQYHLVVVQFLQPRFGTLNIDAQIPQ